MLSSLFQITELIAVCTAAITGVLAAAAACCSAVGVVLVDV